MFFIFNFKRSLSLDKEKFIFYVFLAFFFSHEEVSLDGPGAAKELLLKLFCNDGGKKRAKVDENFQFLRRVLRLYKI